MGRFRLTPRRRRSILKAQHVSAQRRSQRSGMLTKMAISVTTNVVTLGASGKITDFFANNKRKQRRKRKAARARR